LSECATHLRKFLSDPVRTQLPTEARHDRIHGDDVHAAERYLFSPRQLAHLFQPGAAVGRSSSVAHELARSTTLRFVLGLPNPEGKTGNAVADAFSIGSSRARTDLGHLRDWLGTNPRTGRLHLPLAAASRTYEQTGVKTYQVEDVLVDVDLFRRLRARGEARGADGIAYLLTVLRLVEGPPFDYLRERGWSWLLDVDRLHETIGYSIVDTAQIVVLDAGHGRSGDGSQRRRDRLPSGAVRRHLPPRPGEGRRYRGPR